jgi:hypothetical protein
MVSVVVGWRVERQRAEHRDTAANMQESVAQADHLGSNVANAMGAKRFSAVGAVEDLQRPTMVSDRSASDVGQAVEECVRQRGSMRALCGGGAARGG